MQDNHIVEIRDLVKRYPVGGGHFTALRDVTMDMAVGEFTGLVGPSGSGKTTLLNIIGGLDAPSEGAVTVLDGAFGTGDAGIVSFDKLYRLWGRFATEKFELRLGLQKIAFGPGMVLRPLMWFDTLDLRDPTGQTEGVGALRLKWYPWPNLALWGWVVRPDYKEYASPGGRIEYTLGAAEFGLTYHHNKASPLDFVSRPLLPFDSEENRLALDTRLDWKIGLWSEVMIAQATKKWWDGEKNNLQRVMVGGDYTFPWGDGVYVTVEHLWSRYDYLTREEPWPPS